jgi:hypothetical protein
LKVVEAFHFPERNDAMETFLQRHGGSVTGTLSGFDRVRFRGTLRLVANAAGMGAFLRYSGILLKDFARYVQDVTNQVREATEALAAAARRPVVYLQNPSTCKEDVARDIAQRDGVTHGLVCVLSAVEVLWSYDVRRDREAKVLRLVPARRKCLHYYHYFIHPVLGFMHARLATWFPFTLHLCINGREWLGRQLDAARIGYVRRDNCFTHIEDLPRAQELSDAQLKTDWPATLDAIARQVNPVHQQIFAKRPLDYYWSAEESEWASDVMFKSRPALAAIYPNLVRHGMLSLGSRDVMRFLGKRVPAGGGTDKSFKGEVVSDLKQRPEGVRLKYRVKNNAVKMYDKGSVLRVETTINDPHDLKVYRPKEGDREDAPKKWRYMRKGVADLHRRAELCQKANQRYLESMATAGDTTPLGELARKVCHRARWNKRLVRALNPFSTDDARLLEAVNRGEFVLNGFRNRDLRAILYPTAAKSKKEQRKQAAAVTRKLLLLRAHGLINKVPKSHRYQLSHNGRTIIAALLTAQQADTATLAKAA